MDILSLLIDAGLAALALVAPAALAYLSRLAAQWIGADNAERARHMLEGAISNAIAAYADNDSRVAYLRRTMPDTLKSLKADDAALALAILAREKRGR